MEILGPAIVGGLIGLGLRASIGERAGAMFIATVTLVCSALAGVALLGWCGYETYSNGPEWWNTTLRLVIHPEISGSPWHVALVSLLGAPSAGLVGFGAVVLVGEIGWMTWATGLNQNNSQGDPRSRTRFESNVLWVLELVAVVVVVPVALANFSGSSLVTIIGSLTAIAAHFMDFAS